MFVVEEMANEGGFAGAKIAHQQINTSLILHLILILFNKEDK